MTVVVNLLILPQLLTVQWYCQIVKPKEDTENTIKNQSDNLADEEVPT